MRKRFRISGISSLLVTNGGILFFLALTILASIFRLNAVAGLSLFVFLLALISRLWGDFSISRVTVRLDAGSARMFAGEQVKLTYSITNGKLLPLIWLELIQAMPWRQCMLPEEGFEEYTVSTQERGDAAPAEDGSAAAEVGKTALKKKFAFIMGRESLSWDSLWTARRRGVYAVERLTLRSGDGFGLTHAENVVPVENAPTFVIYPRPVPVDATPFLRTQWDTASGTRGYIDDMSVMRGLKPYERGDAWKRINWRMAARGQELQVNLFETIMPRTLHFALDGESFAGLSDDNHELEQTLSVLASLLLQLQANQVDCGLSLPRSVHMPPINLRAGGGEDDLLFFLAGYDILEMKDEELWQKKQIRGFLPSEFEPRPLGGAVRAAGRACWVTHSAASLREHGLPVYIDPARLTVLTYTEPTDTDRLALAPARLMTVDSLRR